MPPSTHGATLSACGAPDAAASPRRAQRTSASFGSVSPNSARTAAAPATLLAAELPRPLPSGICLCSASRTPRSVTSRCSSAACAAMPTTFLFGSVPSESAPVTSVISTPGSSRISASTRSPGRSSASPSTSNPGPRLDAVAGANTRTRSGMRSIMPDAPS